MTTLVRTAAPRTADPQVLADQAASAFDRGDLEAARRCYTALLQEHESAEAHYMLALACKYRGEWQAALQHNLRSLELRNDTDEPTAWNAAIAATALGDWTQARRLWARCGVEVPAGDGPIHGNFGIASVRLNAWGDSETLFARRIDPVRARLINVPLPESGYRYGDIVLHDGTATGTRQAGAATVPVFNALARLEVSVFRTCTAFVGCASPEDADALTGACGPGIGHIEDWTRSISHYCLRCSAGLPHEDDDDEACEAADEQWDTLRTFGIAAQSPRAVEKLLRDWKADGSGRRVQGIESRELRAPTPPAGTVWWRLPGDASES